ncbi:YPL264C [Symbiodinium sp. CCMP2592]|nr:YPL264C [Symbiodinium sp. CCMP2592]
MTPRHQHLLGLLATAGGSLTFVVVVVAIEWLERQEWPALAMLGLANSVVTIGLLALVRQRKIQWPTKNNQRIWLFARGVSSVVGLVCAVLATFFDCPAGDTMAISSTNVFASAVLGCLLFGEAFGKLKIASVFVTTFGAVLVAKPEFIFTSVTEQPYLGYIFAAASGLGLSGIIVCCRKLGNEVSPVISSISSTSQRGASLLLLAVLPLWERDLTSSLEKLYDHAGWAVLWVLGVAIVLAVQATLLSLGSSMAPAGASGVVVTCGDIFFGYIGQILVFGILPDAVTLAGVVLLVGSVLMIMMDTVTATSPLTPLEPEATKASHDGPCEKDAGSPPEEVCKHPPNKVACAACLPW